MLIVDIMRGSQVLIDRIPTISAITAMVSFAVIVWCLPLREISDALRTVSLQLGPLGVVVYALAYFLFTVCCLPVWPMPFLAGALFGAVWGTVVASLSCVVTSAITFWMARLAGHTSWRRLLERSPRLRALEATVQTGDWKVVAAVRISHFLPFGMQNYAFGLTQVNFWRYCVTTWLVTLPGTALQAYLGHLGFVSMSDWRQSSLPGWETWGVRLAGLVAMSAAVVYVGWLARSVYRKTVHKELDRRVELERNGTAPRRRWSIASRVLIVLTVSLAALAIWSVTNRERIRAYTTKALPVHVSMRGDDG